MPLDYMTATEADIFKFCADNAHEFGIRPMPGLDHVFAKIGKVERWEHGFAIVKPANLLYCRPAFLGLMWIDERHRRMGFGRAALIELARKYANHIFPLECHCTGRERVAFFESAGFKRTKQEGRFSVMEFRP